MRGLERDLQLPKPVENAQVQQFNYFVRSILQINLLFQVAESAERGHDGTRSTRGQRVGCSLRRAQQVHAVRCCAKYWMVVTDDNGRTTMNYYLVNLSIADLMITLWCPVQSLVREMSEYNEYALPAVFCKIGVFYTGGQGGHLSRVDAVLMGS